MSEPVPTLCTYHASVYATRSAHLSKVHGDSGDDLRDEAATVARQCPDCVRLWMEIHRDAGNDVAWGAGGTFA
jgi:hypothetical protein